jgi:site-specific DNA recombinase
MTAKTVRAVGYCRTSGEGQRDNASIPVQKEAITRFAEVNGLRLVGWYVDECKSGSKVEGRGDFQKLMKDAGQDIFDAVVIFDVSRFGRDGMVILQSAKTLQDVFGVRVVDTKGGFDTVGSTISNYVHAGMAEEEKRNFLRRTKNAKIRLARENNAPIGSKRPFGRVWKQTGRRPSDGVWVLDPDKKVMIEDVARRYLNGEPLPKLATQYRVNHSNLCKILRERCGPTWVQRVRCHELGIDEEIEVTVPELLPPETVKAVQHRLVANRTYLHKPPRSVHEYLLSGRVFCRGCGYCLIGQTNPRGQRYYRHPHQDRVRPCTARCGWVPGNRLEVEVLSELFKLYGNPAAIARAVNAAVPDLDELTGRRDRLVKELAKVEAQRSRVVDAIADGTITKAQAKARLDSIADQEAAIRAEMDQLAVRLGSVPDAEAVRCFVQTFGSKESPAIGVYDHSGREVAGGNSVSNWLLLMERESGQDRRSLIESAFGAPLADGTPAGVYVSPPPAGIKYRPKKYRFTLRGRLDFEVVVRHASS